MMAANLLHRSCSTAGEFAGARAAAGRVRCAWHGLMKLLARTALTTLSLLAAATAQAQTAAEPRLQSVRADAIPRDVVATLAQDRAGFLWIATGDGVVRYDGHRFRVQERDAAAPVRRSLGWVRAMLATRDGRVWFGTEVDGLAVYEPERDRIVDHKNPALGQAPAPTILALAEDADGGIWMATVGAGLQHFDPRRGSYRRHQQPDNAAGSPDAPVRALLATADGSLWAGSDQGLSRRAPNGTRFEPVPGLPAGSVTALAPATDGRVWIGLQSGGLWVHDPRSGSLTELPAPAAGSEQAQPGAVTSLAEAADGLMWVGRSTGLDLHHASTGRALRALRHDLRRPQGLAGNEVSALLRDQAGAMWVAGYGIGLQRHDPAQAAIAVVTPAPPAAGLPARADLRQLLQHSDGTLWAADHEGRLLQMDAELRVRALLPPQTVNGRALRISALHEAADGRVWLGGDGVLMLVDRRGRPQRTLRHDGGTTHLVHATADGALWAGTGDGLYRWAPGAATPARAALAGGVAMAGDVFTAATGPDGALWVGSVKGLFRTEPGQTVLRPVNAASAEAGLASPVVIGLLLDRQQQLWVDTAVTGLHRLMAWDGRHARFERVSLRHGKLGRPFGASLQEDSQGRIWTHMHVHDPAADTLHALGAADGVNFGTGWFRASARAPDGRLYFGGSRGLLVVQADRFRLPAQDAPLRLTEVRINGQRQSAPPPGGLSLSRAQRSVAIEFAALDYSDNSRYRYSYRLDGFDPDWVPAGPEDRVAAYSNLDPGTYTLRVRAAPREGRWDAQELVLPLRVLPAWWQQPSVKVLAALATLAAVWALLQWRTRRLRRQRQALEHAVALRTAELEAARSSLESRVQARTSELAAATAAAETANRAKTVFLHSVSHEMRTPLNAILGLTYLAEADVAPGQQQRRLGHVTAAAQQLLRLINDVLERAQHEAGSRTAGPAEALTLTATPPPPSMPTLPAAAADTRPPPRFNGERVLLAEDEAVNQIVAVGILERAGLVVDVADNGAQAVLLATANAYALVLMDLQMPELDGLAATRALRATAQGAELPIVALSAFAFDEDRQRCLDAGMNAHLSKPVDPAELLHTVRRWLRQPPA